MRKQIDGLPFAFLKRPHMLAGALHGAVTPCSGCSGLASPQGPPTQHWTAGWGRSTGTELNLQLCFLIVFGTITTFLHHLAQTFDLKQSSYSTNDFPWGDAFFWKLLSTCPSR